MIRGFIGSMTMTTTKGGCVTGTEFGSIHCKCGVVGEVEKEESCKEVMQHPGGWFVEDGGWVWNNGWLAPCFVNG